MKGFLKEVWAFFVAALLVVILCDFLILAIVKEMDNREMETRNAKALAGEILKGRE